MRVDLTGQRFGKLVAVKPVGKYASGNTTIWLFACDCGGTINKTKQSASKSTGCSSCRPRDFNTKHGYRPSKGKTKEYTSWQAMKARCLNPKHMHYARYGGAGITVDPSWIHSFENFLRDVGPCPDDCNSLDRIKSDQGYFKENVQWASATQQANNRTSNIVVTVDGITSSLAEACRRSGVKYTTAKRRLERGLSPAAALTV